MSSRQNPKTIMQQHIHYSSTAEIDYDINVSQKQNAIKHQVAFMIYDDRIYI